MFTLRSLARFRPDRRMYMLVVFCCLISIRTSTGQGTDISERDSLQQVLLERVRGSQSEAYDRLAGVIPSYIRKSRKSQRSIDDNNIYFSAAIAYSLQEIMPYLNSAGQGIAHQIAGGVRMRYPQYLSKSGKPVYNFWPTDSSFVYLYSGSKNEKRMLPDDLDDTVIILMTSGADSAEAADVHGIMQGFTITEAEKVRGVPGVYKDLNTYSTWFGVKFPFILDVCVAANILLFVEHFDLDWTTADSASFQLIRDVIEQRDHVTNPLRVSPYYGRTSIILYHISRLMGRTEITFSKRFKDQLRSDLLAELDRAEASNEKVIIHTSLLWLGHFDRAAEMEQLLLGGQVDDQPIPFFLGNIPSYLPGIIRGPMQGLHWKIFEHHCPSYNDMLYLEFLSLLKEKPGD